MKQGVIKKGEHVFVAGRTGSGKTFLVKKYLENSVLPVYVLDIKRRLNGCRAKGFYIQKNSPRPYPVRKKRLSISLDGKKWKKNTMTFFSNTFTRKGIALSG